MPSINQMKSFIAVVEHGRFSHAAESLNITQTTLTKRIKQLESELDCQLFNRTTRCVTLSSSGHVILHSWVKSLQMYDIGIDALKDHVKNLRPCIKIGLNNFAIRTVGEEYMKKIAKVVHEFTPIIIVSSSHAQIEMVRDGRLDIGFISETKSMTLEPDLKAITVMSTPFRVICNKKNKLSQQKSITVTELAKYDHVFGMKDVYKNDVKNIEAVFNKLSLKWNIVKEHLHTDGIYESVRNNRDLVSLYPVQKDFLLPIGLTSIAVTDPNISSNIQLIWNKNSNRPGAISAISEARNIWDKKDWSEH